MSRLIAIALVGLAIVAAAAATVWALQRRLMYFPDAHAPVPSDVGLADVEPVTFDTADGLTLSGWFLPVRGATPPVTVLILNGNGGNRAYRAPLAQALVRHGFQVLLMDYRGYGGNPGTPTEEGLAADARAARAYLVSRRDVDATRLVYFGESLGTGVAVRLAVEQPPATLILKSPFTSMDDIARHHYSLLPVRGFVKDRYASIERIGRLRAPLLIVAGDRDRIVPLAFSQRLYAAAPEPKRLVVIPGADHNDATLLSGPVVIEAIVGLLRTLP